LVDLATAREIDVKKILILTILALAGFQTIITSRGNDMKDQLLLDDFSV